MYAAMSRHWEVEEYGVISLMCLKLQLQMDLRMMTTIQSNPIQSLL